MKRIILGTAHNENTPGKRSPDLKFREYAYSRKVVDAVKRELEKENVVVYVDMPQASGSANQSVELKERMQIVNKICDQYGPGSCAYISIHVNAAGDGKEWHNAGGWCIFTTKGLTNSDQLATCIYEVAQEELKDYSRIVEEGKKNGEYSKAQKGIRIDYSDNDADLEADFYVIKHTKCPSVLTENMFQDSKADIRWLESEEGFNSVVNIHVKGILKWIERYDTK